MAKVSRGTAFGVGLVCLDYIWDRDNVTQDLPSVTNGGTCGNVMCALSFLGWDTCVATHLQCGDASELLSSNLARAGVSRCTFGRSEAPTPFVVVDAGGGRAPRYTTRCPSCGRSTLGRIALSTKDVETLYRTAANYGVFFYDRVSTKIMLLANRLRREKHKVVFEPNSARRKDMVFQAALESDIFKCSTSRVPNALTDEIRNVAGRDGRGPQLIVRTMGRGGLEYCVRSSSGMTDWKRLGALVDNDKVVDSSGAGDWLTAGIIDRLVRADGQQIDNGLVEEVLKGSAVYVTRCCNTVGALPEYVYSDHAGKRAIGPSGQMTFMQAYGIPRCPWCDHVITVGRKNANDRHSAFDPV